MAPDLVYLVAAGGAPVGFTLPMHESIVKQWRAGELVRVHDDGTRWDEAGDDPDALAALEGASVEQPADPGGADAEPALPPARPRDSAHKRVWAAYAVALGAAGVEEAAGMTRDALIALVTPPEELPPDPEG